MSTTEVRSAGETGDIAGAALKAAMADPGVAEAMAITWPRPVKEVGFGPAAGFRSWSQGLALLGTAADPPPPGLVPIAIVDERSLACVVTATAHGLPESGAVVRWHLDAVPAAAQGGLLDVDAFLYLDSTARELGSREAGLASMRRTFAGYDEEFLTPGRTPRAHVVRPVRLACQNVVAGMAAFAHDSSFDGLAVADWLTCELAHVATHEANRAMTALLLCEAFAAGGTMEIRFDSGGREHPERRVPAALRRFARTVGVWLSDADRSDASITPGEARDLFLAVTPMSEGLRARVTAAAAAGHSSVERMCAMLMSQTWREIELDFLLAVSARAASILAGGASVTDRGARQAESDVARAALMVGMLHRRLDHEDQAVGDRHGVRVLEDARHGIEWDVHGAEAAVAFSHVRDAPLPWQDPAAGTATAAGDVLVVPRPWLEAEVVEEVAALAGPARPVAVLVPADADASAATRAGLTVLRCPDRIAELDMQVETRLTKARVSRS